MEFPSPLLPLKLIPSAHPVFLIRPGLSDANMLVLAKSVVGKRSGAAILLIAARDNPLISILERANHIARWLNSWRPHGHHALDTGPTIKSMTLARGKKSHKDQVAFIKT